MDNPIVGIPVPKNKILFNWMDKFMANEQQIESFSDPKWLYRNLIIQGHIIVLPAKPNGGKTTICMYLAAQLSSEGYDVIYVNADVGQSDVKAMWHFAKDKKFKLLTPDLVEGQSMESVKNDLVELNNSGGDFSGTILFIDTLKKMADVIVKSQAKELYQLFRSLSAKGMTIVLLAHTNKYDDAEGNPIYEGTGDLRADVDELIYLIPQKNDDGSMTVSTQPDKVRGLFEPITFNISANRDVTLLDEFIDVADSLRTQNQLEKDNPVIELIMESIKAEQFTEAKIIAYVKNSGSGFGWRTVTAVLKRYIGMHWTIERACNNAKQYFLITSNSAPQT